jgi:hypothetical protein
MSEHTPGPWTAAPCSRAGYWIAVDKHPFSVVATLDEEGRYGAIEGDNAEANARLIAAAPDLLAVVEEAIRLYGKPGGPWNVPSDPGGWIARAQAAVAKARGTMPSMSSQRSEGDR